MNACVLVVDDEAHVLQVMRTFLERAGFVVHTASNGVDGYKVFEETQPDAIITDFEMPQRNGRELIEQVLLSDTSTPSLIYLVTSRTDVELRDWVERTERVFFLEKPASPRRLVHNQIGRAHV